jgi:hypothetical protein
MKKNKGLISAIVTIMWFAFSYGCISFFNMDINAANWPIMSRLMMVIFGFIIGVVIGIISLTIELTNHE